MTIVNTNKERIIPHKTFNESDYKYMAEDKTERYVGFRTYQESWYARYKREVEDVTKMESI